MAKPSLDSLSIFGGAALVTPTEAEFAPESGLNLAAVALHGYREAAERFAAERTKIERNARFSPAGKAAELGEFALRSLNELGRTDAILERAQAQLAELLAEARKVPIEDLSPAQLALLPTVYDRLAEVDPLELPGLLAEAAEARDVVTLAVFLSAPRSKFMRLAVTNEQLDAAREAAAGPLPGDKRKLLARLRELVGAAEATRKALVGELRRAGNLHVDPLVLAAFGGEQDKPANDPIAKMAVTGKAA